MSRRLHRTKFWAISRNFFNKPATHWNLLIRKTNVIFSFKETKIFPARRLQQHGLWKRRKSISRKKRLVYVEIKLFILKIGTWLFLTIRRENHWRISYNFSWNWLSKNSFFPYYYYLPFKLRLFPSTSRFKKD